jgi:hypothetical protein
MSDIVTRADGTVVYRGILGGWQSVEPQPERTERFDNVIYFAEYKERRKWASESPSSPEEPRPGAA